MAKTTYKKSFKYKETNCSIISDNKKAITSAINSIKDHRRKIEQYIKNNPIFLHSLKPIIVEKEPLVVRLMAEAAKMANVGPMAAVAGVLADLAVEKLKKTGCNIAVVENGGEISAISNQPIDVALVAGDSQLSRRFGFRLKNFPLGIATSSGLFSHALSFGKSEATTIFAKNAGLADAAATAVANLIKGKNKRLVIKKGIDEALSIDGVEGVLIIFGGIVGTAGKIPQIIQIS